MPTFSDDQLKYVKYKWEFLRRNPKYIDDWDKLQNILEHKYEDWYPPYGKTPEEVEFCKRWEIWNPFPPENSYDDIVRIGGGVRQKENSTFEDIDAGTVEEMLVKGGFDLKRMMCDSMFPEFLPGRTFTIMDGWDYDHDGDFLLHRVSDHLTNTGELTVKINLNYSKKRLADDFKTLINGWKILYENSLSGYELKERKTKYQKKFHFDNFDLYLQVYDLRQEGMSWAKIKSTLDLNSVQTGRNHYNAACELIEKGVELYVK